MVQQNPHKEWRIFFKLKIKYVGVCAVQYHKGIRREEKVRYYDCCGSAGNALWSIGGVWSSRVGESVCGGVMEMDGAEVDGMEMGGVEMSGMDESGVAWS
jgi:hypothetical protein